MLIIFEFGVLLFDCFVYAGEVEDIVMGRLSVVSKIAVPKLQYTGWHGGLVVGCRTCDLRVAGSRPGRDAAAQQP